MFVGSRRMRFQSYHDVDLESNSRAWWIEQSLARWYKCRRDRVELASLAKRPIHLFLSWLRSFSKNRRPHSDQRCAFFNRDREILRHSHRELRKIDMKLRLHASAQLAQLNKIFPRSFGFLGDRRDRHKPQDRQPWQREQRFHFCAQLVRFHQLRGPLSPPLGRSARARARDFQRSKPCRIVGPALRLPINNISARSPRRPLGLPILYGVCLDLRRRSSIAQSAATTRI